MSYIFYCSKISVTYIPHYYLEQIEKVIALKKSNPALKILVSVGGYGAGSKTFPQVVRDATARMNLISTSLVHIQTYGFDGLDIVWEYPISTDKV